MRRTILLVMVMSGPVVALTFDPWRLKGCWG